MNKFDFRTSKSWQTPIAVSPVAASPDNDLTRSPLAGDPSINCDDDEQNVAGTTGITKKRRLGTTDFTRRKRAVTACQFCRVRKTRCDNTRPRCGYCTRHKARCIYGEETEEPVNNSGSAANLATNHQEVLARLDELKDMLQGGQSSVNTSKSIVGLSPALSSPQVRSLHTASPQSLAHDTWKGDSQGMPTKTTRQTLAFDLETRRPSFASLRCEAVLKWPALRDVVPNNADNIVSFPFEYALENDQKQENTSSSSRSMPDDQFVHFSKRFLAIVHPRNPILDGHDLLHHARLVEENGLQWDSASCLVLIACALGSYTLPWVKPSQIPDIGDAWQGSTVFEKENRATAEAYYAAALKRVGPLGHSVRDIQCFFLASVFEKFSLRPLQAWSFIQQACFGLQTLFLARGERPGAPFRGSQTEDRHLEQRLFWSCCRAENEFLLELDFRPSGLNDFSYPDAFPEPPEDLEFTATEMSSGTGERPNCVDDTHSRINERGWCYYLSEISLRRTIDETVALLYQKGEAYWLQNSSQLVRHYWGSERQIASWQYHIPAIVKFNDNEPPDEEFACYLWFRALEWREYTLRPILYCVLHSSPERTATVEEKELAQAALEIYETVIPQRLYALRHGGSWFAARRTFTSAALILAVVINPGSGLVPSKRWPSLVQSAICVLRYWGQVARDIRLAATILTEMYEKTRQHIEYTYTD